MIDIEKVTIKYMDRNQIKELRKAGLDPAYNDAKDAKSTADMVDWILDNIYPGIDFSGVPYHKVMMLAANTYKKAMGGEEAIKN